MAEPAPTRPSHPYEDLEQRALWKPAVAQSAIEDIARSLWRPKFAIRHDDPISTFGSCFAQHIGQALKRQGCSWLVSEQPPDGLDEATSKKFGYGIFSCRTGNIYTTTLLRQWTHWALGQTPPPEIWRDSERFYDPFRPALEP